MSLGIWGLSKQPCLVAVQSVHFIVANARATGPDRAMLERFSLVRRTTVAFRAAVSVLFLTVVGCGPTDATRDPSLGRTSLTTRRLTTSGRWLLDEQGRKVLLRGVNAGGRAKMEPFVPFDFAAGSFEVAADSYFERIAALGANAVRLTLSWEGLEPVEGRRDPTYWQRYRAMVDAAHAHGVGVIVEFHQDAYASPFCGDGFPLWTLGALAHGPPHYDCSYLNWSLPYFDPGSTVNQAFARLWSNADGLRSKFASMWQFVATELGRHPGVLGFEIINEPGVGTGDPSVFQQSVLPAFYSEIGAVIEAAAGPSVIFGGTNAGDSSTSHALVLPKLKSFAFAPHYYDALAFLNIDLVDPARLRSALLKTITLPNDPQIPIVVGEYGMPNANPAKEGYLDAMLGLFDEYRLHAIHWDAHQSAQLWNHEDFSVFRPDGSQQEWARALDRPFPRAVAGGDVTFSYDLTSSVFELVVTAATSGVTEIYIPKQRFGSDPQVSTQGARWNWLPESQLLILAAAPGQSYTARVTPR